MQLEDKNNTSITLHNVTVTRQNKNKSKNKELDIYSENSFNQFWDVYDKKKDADKCKKKFKTLTKDEIDIILLHVPEYVKSTPDKQFRKNPITYLNNKCWNDEIIKSEGNNGSINANFKFRKQTNDKRFPVIILMLSDYRNALRNALIKISLLKMKIEMLSRAVRHLDLGQCLTLTGQVGTGKTHLAVATLKNIPGC